nr:LacI family DNA-binding transcriptional regulator [Streptomyces indicus]
MAGVSQATVSLVLNAAHDRVGEATRRRVMDAITRTGYTANPLAQRLARGRNQIVGVFTYEPVFPSTGADFYFPFLRGIEAEAERRACDLLLFTSAPVVDGRRSLTAQGRAQLAVTDGCVLLGRGEDKAELARLSEDGFPFVFVGRRELPGGADLAFVGADYARATADVVGVLLSHGHERIGYVGAAGDREAHRDRLAGYRAALREAGLRPLTLDPAGLTPDEIVDLVLDNRLTGLLLAESHRAEELRAAAARRGLDVPRDLSLAVLGQPELPLRSELSWTGFRIPREEMGAQALALLADLIDGRAVDRHRILPCAPQPGQTVAAAR